MQASFQKFLDTTHEVKYKDEVFILEEPPQPDCEALQKEWHAALGGQDVPNSRAHSMRFSQYCKALSLCTTLDLNQSKTAILNLRDGELFPTPVETKAAILCGLDAVDFSIVIGENLAALLGKKLKDDPEADPEKIGNEIVDEAIKRQEEEDAETEPPLP